jgi:exopolysaccharide biosynthesis predicted pyruvyltransferase EpsI
MPKESERLSDLENLLRSLRGKQVVYLPNPGNAGDSVIAHSTYQLFDKIGLQYEIGHHSRTYPNRIVILGGGGNLVESYGDNANFIKRNLGQLEQLIVLPHTIRAHADLLVQFGSNCFLFCREAPSFEFAKSNAPGANVFLFHDMALLCDFTETKRLMSHRFLKDMAHLHLHVRNAKRLIRVCQYWAANRSAPKTLNSFRTDIERTDIAIPKANIDLSQAFSADDMSPASSLHTTYFMMQFIDRFDIVRTNRLHVAIMSAMLGKTVYMSDNSYGKNRDVFLHSLAGRFPKLHWYDG